MPRSEGCDCDGECAFAKGVGSERHEATETGATCGVRATTLALAEVNALTAPVACVGPGGVCARSSHSGSDDDADDVVVGAGCGLVTTGRASIADGCASAASHSRVTDSFNALILSFTFFIFSNTFTSTSTRYSGDFFCESMQVSISASPEAK